MTAQSENIPVQKSFRGKRLEIFSLNLYWEVSALDDGFEAVGFEVVAGDCGGLGVRIRAYLNAKVFVRAGGDDVGGEFGF